MTPRVARLERLQKTLERLQDVVAKRIAVLQEERRELYRRRTSIETLMAGDTRFLDLTTGGALRRLREIAARLNAIEAEEKRQKKRSAEAFIKAKRAGEMAGELRAEHARKAEQLALAELADRLAPASLRQAGRG